MTWPAGPFMELAVWFRNQAASRSVAAPAIRSLQRRALS